MSGPPRQCARGHSHEVLTIGLMSVDGETTEETYAKWQRKRGRNPWCDRPLTQCPEPEPKP